MESQLESSRGDLWDFIMPLIQAVFFIAGVYIEKSFRKKMKIRKQYKPIGRVIVISLITLILMAYHYSYTCEPSDIGFNSCFYFHFDLRQCVRVLFANTLLFGHQIYLLYEKKKVKEQMKKINKSLSQKYEEKQDRDILRSWIFAPLLEEILFRAIFYRSSRQKVSIFYLALVFALMHFHPHIYKMIKGKNKGLTPALFHFLMTFIFALYSLYWLYRLQSIIPVILLHSYCNVLGQPIVKKKSSVQYHLLSILAFALFLIFFN